MILSQNEFVGSVVEGANGCCTVIFGAGPLAGRALNGWTIDCMFFIYPEGLKLVPVPGVI